MTLPVGGLGWGPSVIASRRLPWGGEYWGPVGSTYTDLLWALVLGGALLMPTFQITSPAPRPTSTERQYS